MTGDTWALRGARVILTGGRGDIGLVCATRLRELGAHVLLADLADAPTDRDSLMRNGFNDADLVDVDITEIESVSTMFAHAREIFGAEPDVVCAHAGVVGSWPIQEYPPDAFDALMATNVRGSFLVAREAARRWRAEDRRGNLIFTTSWVQDVPWPSIGPYSSSKAAVRALMRSFARELAPYGIRANALAPGIVGVGMARRQWDTDSEYRVRAGRAIPMGELQTPESVADAMAFLASPRSGYMTGSTLLVDGGASLYPLDQD